MGRKGFKQSIQANQEKALVKGNITTLTHKITGVCFNLEERVPRITTQ